MYEHSLLLVDDNQDILDQMSRWFSNHGFQVTAMRHPRLALAAVTLNHFDAAIIDLRLPEVNGLELVEQMHRLVDLPVVVQTGDDRPKTLKAAIELGVYRVLLKPVRLRVIEKVIVECIEASKKDSNQRETIYSGS